MTPESGGLPEAVASVTLPVMLPSFVSAAFVVVVVPATTATLLITNMTYPVSLKVRE